MGLITLSKYIHTGYNIDVLLLISVISILFGILTIVARNPIHSILFLIGLFVTISIYLILSGLVFIGISYLLIYVGAISILFLFVIMLINIRVSELVTEGKNSLLLALLCVIIFNYTFNNIIPSNLMLSNSMWIYNEGDIINNLTGELTQSKNTIINVAMEYATHSVGNVNNKLWEVLLVQISHISAIGNILYTNLFIFLILTSLILLLAMIGAIVITTKPK